MKEKKGFISWKDAGPRKVMDGCEVAPDRVKVYFNLNLDCLSVIDAETGLLYCHAHRVEIHNAKFRVQPAGRERVLREKRKNVHAYIIGDCHDIGEVSKERFRLVEMRSRSMTSVTAVINLTTIVRSVCQSQATSFAEVITILISMRRLWMTSRKLPSSSRAG